MSDYQCVVVVASALSVLHHADDLIQKFRLARLGLQAESAANHIRLSEELSGKHLIHNGDLRRAERIAIAELPPPDQLRSHGVEIARTHSIKIRLFPTR